MSVADLQHPHEDVSPVAVLLLGLGADAVDQVQQQFTGHGLDVTGERLVVDVFGEQLDSQRQICQRQILTNMVHQVCKCAVG